MMDKFLGKKHEKSKKKKHQKKRKGSNLFGGIGSRGMLDMCF
jgi:hypothetical protein